ncbi:MAG: hypothetical protein K2G63_02750 [Oscillospiraceae bacterium]|nr:hypothetical protein [Oscillospiraceae bacterium]
MDIKEKIEEIVKKIKNDKNFEKEFKQNPIKSVENILGVDLPDDKINAIVDGIKAKISVDDMKNKIGGIFDKIKNNK